MQRVKVETSVECHIVTTLQAATQCESLDVLAVVERLLSDFGYGVRQRYIEEVVAAIKGISPYGCKLSGEDDYIQAILRAADVIDLNVKGALVNGH